MFNTISTAMSATLRRKERDLKTGYDVLQLLNLLSASSNAWRDTGCEHAGA